MDKFANLTFKLAKVWEQDWDELIESSDGVRRELLQSISNVATMLHTASKWTPTPERLAWITLWSRNWTLSTSAVGALDNGSPFLLELIWRSAFELNMQLSAIIDPNASGILPKNEFTLEEISDLKDRIRAYMAWILINDQMYLSNLLRRDTLDKTYNSEEYDDETEAQLESATLALWGSSERPVMGDEAAREKKEARSSLFSRRNVIVDLLEDDRLQEWRNLIERERPRTYYALLSKFDSSIAQRMKTIGFEFAKILYDRPSSLLHGSTMEGFVHISNNSITPEPGISHKEAEREAANVHRYCHNNGVALEMLSAILDLDIDSHE